MRSESYKVKRQVQRLLFLLSAVLLSEQVVAQTITPGKQSLGKLISASPDAAAIAMYQNYPVDYVSGAPGIEIPLFEVPTRAGVLPFKLSYHIGSLKPSESTNVAGWGWTVSPNIGVTRSVKGGVDGVGTGYPANTDFGSSSNTYYLAAASNTADEQPDDFYYSLLSKSGRFVYDRAANFVTIPYEAIKVSHTDNNSFTITDDDGTIYKFGKYSTGSTTVTESAGSSPVFLTSWKVTEIIPFDKSDTIRFIYESTSRTNSIPYYNIQWTITEYPEISEINTIYPTHVYSSIYNQDGVYAGETPHRPAVVFTSSIYDTNYDFDLPSVPTGSYKTTFTTGTGGNTNQLAAWANFDYGSPHDASSAMSDNTSDYLPISEIQFKGGKVTFSYGPDNQLSVVGLYTNYTGSTTMVKRVKLFQHQLSHADAEQPLPTYNLAKRYGLDSVVIGGINNQKPLTYRMEYTKGAGLEESVGIYGGLGSDYWGFWNNSYIFTVPRVLHYVPNYSWHSALANSNTADPSGSGMLTGMWLDIGSKQERDAPSAIVPGIIKKIIYPTGGSAEFEFENNQYQSSYTTSHVVYGGGYRVKSIKYTTGDGRENIIKVYKYGTNEDGVGRTKYKNYAQNFMSQRLELTKRSNPADPGTFINFLKKITTVNSKPVLDMSFASGAAVLYQQVSEYTIALPDSAPLGKTVYNYVIDSKNDGWVDMAPIQGDARDDWKVISLTDVANYRYQNNTFNIINRTAYGYANFYTDTIPAAQTYQKFYNTNEPSDPLYNYYAYVTDPFPRIVYDIYAGARKQTSVKDTLFNVDNPAQYLATTTTIGYEPTRLYKSYESKLDSKNSTLKSEYYYSFNTIPDLVTGQQTLLNSLNTLNRLNQPVEVKEYSGSAVLRTVQQNFAQYAGSRIYPSAIYTSTYSNPLEKNLEMGLYDANGNILEQRKADDVKEVYLWGYNGRYPVAKVTGSDFATVQGFISQTMLDNAHNYTDVQMRTELQKIRTGLANTKAQVQTYTYMPMTGMTSVTDPNGKVMYYEYDAAGRLIFIKDNNGHIIKMFCYNYAGQPEDCGTTGL